MLITIDPANLTGDERYHLAHGLEALENPNSSCKKLIAELRRLSNESHNKHCREHPYDWV